MEDGVAANSDAARITTVESTRSATTILGSQLVFQGHAIMMLIALEMIGNVTPTDTAPKMLKIKILDFHYPYLLIHSQY
jgi:hypothetical protein